MRALSNFVLFAGAAGLMLLLSVNVYSLMAGGPNAVSFFSSEWFEIWGAAYAGFSAALIFGVIGAMSAASGRRPLEARQG